MKNSLADSLYLTKLITILVLFVFVLIFIVVERILLKLSKKRMRQIRNKTVSERDKRGRSIASWIEATADNAGKGRIELGDAEEVGVGAVCVVVVGSGSRLAFEDDGACEDLVEDEGEGEDDGGFHLGACERR